MSLPFDPNDPFRLTVLKRLTSCIEGVSVANGYQHDLAGKVKRGRVIFGDDEPLPMIAILEPPIPLEVIHGRADNPGSTGDWEVLIQGFVPDDRDNPTDPAHLLMADVKKALIAEKMRMGGNDIFGLGPRSEGGSGAGNRVLMISVGQGSVRPADEVSARAYFWLMLSIKLAENHLDPYG